jgi:hypothetical protein
MTTDRTWEIKVQVNGKWEARTVTLAQYRAELDARAAMTKPIMDAWRRGDIAACEAAQKSMREKVS